MVVKHNGSVSMPINAFAIASALYMALRLSGGISGGCINPAVGLVQSVYQKVMNNYKYPHAPQTELVYVLAYVGGPFAGAFVAGFYQKCCHERIFNAAKKYKNESYG